MSETQQFLLSVYSLPAQQEVLVSTEYASASLCLQAVQKMVRGR